MDSDNLRTASLYINNQLLSRGLLRNGQNIDFARPDRAVADGGEGLEKTMGRVMSVVNDLILRRDVSTNFLLPYAGRIGARASRETKLGERTRELGHCIEFMLIPRATARRSTTRNPHHNPQNPTCRYPSPYYRYGTFIHQTHRSAAETWHCRVHRTRHEVTTQERGTSESSVEGGDGAHEGLSSTDEESMCS